MAFTCGFVRQECSHAELFRANYQRTNRTKGSKILRCFPHCCPDHVSRSFCGAPLYLDVHWDAKSSDHKANGPCVSDEHHALPRLLVFGRFRLRHEMGFPVGAVLSPDAVARSVQSDDNPNGEWITSTLVQQPTSARDRRPWRFELNGRARWFYGWESGVAKSHRLREHVLDVLVVTHTSERFRVVAAAQSPPFKMISFRRATPEALSLLAASSAPTAPLDLPPQAPVRQRWHTNANASVAPAVASLASQVCDLATLWRFIERIPLRRVVSLMPTMESVLWRQLEQRWTPTNAHHSSTSADEALSRLLQLAGDLGEEAEPPTQLLEIACHVALWFWWDPAVHTQWRRLRSDAAAALLDGHALRWCFEAGAVRWLWTKLDAFLASSTDCTLAELVAAVEPGRVDASDAAAWAYEAFVAHAREEFVDQQRHTNAVQRSSLRLGDGGADATSRPSVFDGEWVATLRDLDVDTTRSRESASHWRLVHLLWFWREFSALAIQYDSASKTLHVRSLLGHPETDPDPGKDEGPQMALVLDHQCRWTRHLPSGASTLAVSLGGSCVGDYVGKVAPSGREIHLNWYAWPSGDEGDDALYASCFQVHARAATAASEPLRVRVMVNHGRVDPRSLGLDAPVGMGAELQSRSLRQRLALVREWQPSAEWLGEYQRRR